MPAEDSSASVLPEPWRSFLGDLDGLLKGPVELRCLGGFVITQQYGIGRETSDIDYLALAAQSRDDDERALLRGTAPLLAKQASLARQDPGALAADGVAIDIAH